LPQIILDLIANGDDTGNSDILAPLAWFLGQDLNGAPSNWAEFGALQQAQQVVELFKFNDTRFDNFWYWSSYMGLTTLIGSPKPGGVEERLLPDPTNALRNILRRVLEPFPGYMQATECLRRVAVECQLFEGGIARQAMDAHAPPREKRHLSPSTSLALLRLEAEGTLAIRLLADANALILVDGSARRPISEIAWIPKGAGGVQ
jgi:hypothetical protein